MMKALEIGLVHQGFRVRKLSRINKSLWESPFQSPSLTAQAFLDKFLIKNPRFSPPISALRAAPKGLFEVNADFDYAILAWLPGLLDISDYQKLSNTPTIVRVPDENPFTAVCHYTNGCNGFVDGCSECPAVRSFAAKKVQVYLDQKISNYKNLNRKAFVCPSKWVAKKASESLALRDETVRVIRNPIDESFFLENTATKRAKKFTVLFVASQVFDPVKGFDGIVEKLDELAKTEGIEVRVVGNSGTQARRFKSIRFLGSLNASELAKEYKRAWVTIVPSKNEASGNVVGESMASGTPVLARNIDGLAEVAGQLSPALLFHSNEELFQKLMSLDFRGYHKNREVIRDIARQHEPEFVAQQYASLLKSL